MQFSMLCLLLGASLAWQKLFEGYSRSEMFTVILVMQILGWALQFVGHGVFESNCRPTQKGSRLCWTTCSKSSRRPSSS